MDTSATNAKLNKRLLGRSKGLGKENSGLLKLADDDCADLAFSNLHVENFLQAMGARMMIAVT